MLYFIEALGFFFFSLWLLSQGFSKKVVLGIFSCIFVIAFFFDPILYFVGFFLTAHTFHQSLWINGVPFCGGLSGVIYKCLKTYIQG